MERKGDAKEEAMKQQNKKSPFSFFEEANKSLKCVTPKPNRPPESKI